MEARARSDIAMIIDIRFMLFGLQILHFVQDDRETLFAEFQYITFTDQTRILKTVQLTQGLQSHAIPL